MQITIRYDSREQAQAAMNVSDYRSLIQDIDECLRDEIKDGDGSKKIKSELQKIRDFMHETARGLNIEIY